MTPLTAERVRYIRAKLAENWTQKRIADRLGLSPSYISDLIREHPTVKPIDPIYEAHQLRRWLYTHKIGDIGKRAVEETQ